MRDDGETREEQHRAKPAREARAHPVAPQRRDIRFVFDSHVAIPNRRCTLSEVRAKLRPLRIFVCGTEHCFSPARHIVDVSSCAVNEYFNTAISLWKISRFT